jgi:hypothetical protein
MMNGIQPDVALWPFMAIQLFGLLSAFAARLGEGHRWQTISHWSFLIALPLMGVATVVALVLGPGLWLACAASLSVMVLTAVSDLRARPEIGIG